MIKELQIGWGDGVIYYEVGKSQVTKIVEIWLDTSYTYNPETMNDIITQTKHYNIFKGDKLFKTVESSNSLTIEYFI